MDQVLSSWKEIASFLGRGVRTAQRWEKACGLPVFRPSGKPQSVVFAHTADLLAWMQSPGATLEANTRASQNSEFAVARERSLDVRPDSTNKVSPWSERQFLFPYPATQYPNLCMRLRGTPPRLEDMLCDLPAEVCTDTADGKWSVLEEAGHLLDMEPLWFARVEDFFYGDTLTTAECSDHKPSEGGHNAHHPQKLLTEFRAARGKLLSRLETLPQASFSRTLLHPQLRVPVQLVDHLYLVAEHDDHHLARILEHAQTIGARYTRHL